VGLDVEHGQGEHGHGVGVLGQVGDELHLLLGEVSLALPLAGEGVELVVGGVSAGEQ